MFAKGFYLILKTLMERGETYTVIHRASARFVTT